MKQTPTKQDKPIPDASDVAVRAKGIVTRMGRNPQGFGGEAIEPGPVGDRPKRLVLITAVRDDAYQFLRSEWHDMPAADRPSFEAFVGLLLTVFAESIQLARGEQKSCAAAADRAVGGEAARGAGGRGGAVPLGNHGEMNSVVPK